MSYTKDFIGWHSVKTVLIFWGVPLTTQIKDNPYYFPIHFKDKDQCVMLGQMRVFASRRLSDKMGQMPVHHFEDIKSAIYSILESTQPPRGG